MQMLGLRDVAVDEMTYMTLLAGPGRWTSHEVTLRSGAVDVTGLS